MPKGAAADTGDINDLIADIYDAALDEAHWPRALHRLRGAVGASNSTLVFLAGKTAAKTYMHGIDPLHLGSYAEHYRLMDPVYRRVSAGPPGKIWSNEMVHTKAELHRTELHADWCRPAKMEHTLQAIPFRNRYLAGFLALARPPSRQAFAARDFHLLDRLMPHFERAISVQTRVNSALASCNAAMEALECLAHGIFFIDAYGLITEMNRAAQALLGPHTGLVLTEGILQTASSDQTSALQRLMAQVCRADGTRGQGGYLRVVRADSGPALRMLVIPSRDKIARCRLDGAAGLLLVDAGVTGQGTTTAAMVALFDLTRAEATIALLTARGAGAPAIAAELGVAHNTVRTHLRHVFDKTGTRSQAELGILVARLPAGTDATNS